MTQSKDPDNSYNDYIEKRHAQWQTPTSIINGYVEQVFGNLLEDQTRIIAGEQNEVYSGRVEDKEVIVRISHEDDQPFKREKWALEQVHAIGVPVPKVYGVFDFKIEGKDRELCLMERLRGKPLGELRKKQLIDPESEKVLLRKVGNLLRKVHSISTQGFGTIDDQGKGRFTTIEEWVDKKLHDLSSLDDVAERRNIAPSDLRQVGNILRKNSSILTTEPRLTHGDLGFGHIFVEGDTVTGIIDWEHPQSNDPTSDFAWWNTFHPQKELYSELLDGYEETGKVERTFDRRMHTYKLTLIPDLLYYYDMTDFKSGIDIVRRNIQEELEYFSK